MRDETLTDLAGQFLREAVFASRDQAQLRMPGDTSGCGMGPGAAIPDTFSGKQRTLLGRMLEAGAAAPDAVLFNAVALQAESWIKLQDGLDRKRNHFLKDFRHEHGFDRNSYRPEVQAAFQAGLAALNGEQQQRLESHAAALARLFTAAGDVAKRS